MHYLVVDTQGIITQSDAKDVVKVFKTNIKSTAMYQIIDSSISKNETITNIYVERI